MWMSVDQEETGAEGKEEAQGLASNIYDVDAIIFVSSTTIAAKISPIYVRVKTIGADGS